MTGEDKAIADNASLTARPAEADREDLLDREDQFIAQEIPPGVGRRTFLMRSAVISAAAMMTGRSIAAQAKIQQTTGTPPKLDANLNVVKKTKGPVLTTLDEFYKVGPSKSSVRARLNC